MSDFAEVLYFFRLKFGEVRYSLALVSIFSPPDIDLLNTSYHTVYSCEYQGECFSLLQD